MQVTLASTSRVNARDVAAGAVLLAVAVLGLWLNGDHTLGTARRMGPGYLPMLVFAVQAALGVLVMGLALRGGAARLERWPGREIVVVLAALCAFALLLERGGLMLAVAAAVGVSALADREQRPLGVAGLILSLMALCWWVFVRQLALPVSVWPPGLGLG